MQTVINVYTSGRNPDKQTPSKNYQGFQRGWREEGGGMSMKLSARKHEDNIKIARVLPTKYWGFH